MIFKIDIVANIGKASVAKIAIKIDMTRIQIVKMRGIIIKTAQKIVEEGKLCSHVFGYNRKYIAMAGSTDVGDVSWQTPTGQIHVAAWPNGSPGHSWQNVSCAAAMEAETLL